MPQKVIPATTSFIRRRAASLWQRLLRYGERHRLPVSKGNDVRLLPSGTEILGCLRTLIGRAQLTVHFEIYEWANDTTGRDLMASLQEAQARDQYTGRPYNLGIPNGWDAAIRQRTAAHFQLELAEMEYRHHLTFDTYEEGKITLKEYLARVVFYQARPFTLAQFQQFMFAQSEPCPQMMDLVRTLKAKYGLKTVVVSNEGQELNAHRIRAFKLDTFLDCFVSSCFVQRSGTSCRWRSSNEPVHHSDLWARPSLPWALP